MMIRKGQLEKSLRFVEIFGIIVTLALLPLDRLPYLHTIPFNLGLVSAVFLFTATLARLSLVLRQKRFADFKKYVLVGCILILPVVGYAISTTYALDRSFALGATVLLAAVAARAFSFFVLISETPVYWLLTKKTIYVVSAVVVLYGFFQFLFDVWGAPASFTDLRQCCTSNSTYVFPRVHSTAFEPLYFDHFLMIPLWLLTFDFLRNIKARKNKYLVALFVAISTLFILTIARSAIAALIIAGIFFYISGRATKKFGLRIKNVAKLWGVAILLSVVLILMSGVASMLIDKKAQYGSRSGVGSVALFGGHIVDIDDGSAKTRYEAWPKAVTFVTEENPPKSLVGVGADNSRIWLNWEDYKQGTPIEKLQPFNNDLIGLVVDLGLLAILTFGPLLGALVFCIYRLSKKAWTATVAPMSLALVGMLIQGNFFQSLLLTRTWVVIGIVLIVLGPTRGVLNIKDEDSY